MARGIVLLLSFCLSVAGAYHLFSKGGAACYTVVSDGVIKPVEDSGVCVSLSNTVSSADLRTHVAVYDRMALISAGAPLSEKTISEFIEHRKLIAASRSWLH
jgi:hypothetical protein